MSQPTLLREKPCRQCGTPMVMTFGSRRVYCADCNRLRGNEKMRRLRTQRQANIDPDASWHGTTHGYTGHGCRCEMCRNAYRAYSNEWRKRPEVAERIRANARKYAKTPRERLRRKARQYGLEPDLLDSYLSDRVCFACGAADVNLNVDHDHGCCPSNRKVCGECVRGLLCSSCNIALGAVSDDLGRLRNLIAYLERWEARRG